MENPAKEWRIAEKNAGFFVYSTKSFGKKITILAYPAEAEVYYVIIPSIRLA